MNRYLAIALALVGCNQVFDVRTTSPLDAAYFDAPLDALDQLLLGLAIPRLLPLAGLVEGANVRARFGAEHVLGHPVRIAEKAAAAEGSGEQGKGDGLADPGMNSHEA